MSSNKSKEVNCTHSNADLCDGFKYFSENKEEQLRQLKPFADKDRAHLTDLIQKAWNLFSANDRAIYHEEANVTFAEFKKWIIEEEGDSGVGDRESKSLISEFDEDNDNPPPEEKKEHFYFSNMDITYPAIIYIRELNSIILQDDYFSTNQKGIPRMLLHTGWTQLRQEQREEYVEKSKKSFICRKKKSPYHRIAKAEFNEFDDAIDNKEDRMAVSALLKDTCPHQDSAFSWCHIINELFFVLTPTQRDEYYDMGYRHRESKIAARLFKIEKHLEDHAEGSYCLECEFDNLNAPDKKEYFKNAAKIVQDYRANLSKGIEDTASIEDYDAVPFDMCWGTNQENRAFAVYLHKMRKTPELENKRNFELKIILKKQWAILTLEEKQPYYDALLRIDEIDKEISERQLCCYDFFQIKEGKKVFYSDLSSEERAELDEEALQARKQLLEDYPDLKEYFGWRHADRPDRKDRQDQSEYDIQLKEYSGKPFIVKQKFESAWFAFADYEEGNAHQTFDDEVCTHWKKGLNDDTKWTKWMELTDAQQAQWYKKYMKNNHKTVALSTYWHEVDPADDEGTMCCNNCGFDRLDKADKKEYMRKSKRRVIRIVKRERKERQKRLVKEELEEKSVDYSEPKHYSDSTHLYIENVDAYYVSKIYVSPYNSLEYNAFYPYFKKHIKLFYKDPENQHLPYARICEKVEQSFWDLPDDERKPYFDAVIRYAKLEKQLRPLSGASFYFDHVNKDTTLRFYHMSEGERPFYEKEMMQERVQLLRENPDLTNYFYFEKRCRSHGHQTYTYFEDSKNKNRHEKWIPTAFMCYVHAVCPLMKQQDPIFKKKTEYQQKWILGMNWSEFSKEQKAVVYEKQRRVQDRVAVKQFFEQFSGLTFDDSKQCNEEIQTSS